MSNGLKQDISIGKNLKALRKSVGLTQGQACAHLGSLNIEITSDILAKIEQGRYSIKISVLLGMKEIYRVGSFDKFFEGLPELQPFEK